MEDLELRQVLLQVSGQVGDTPFLGHAVIDIDKGNVELARQGPVAHVPEIVVTEYGGVGAGRAHGNGIRNGAGSGADRGDRSKGIPGDHDPVLTERTRFFQDMSGQLLERARGDTGHEQGVFVTDHGPVREKALLPSEKGGTLRKIFLPRNIYAVQSLPFVLSGFPFESQDDISFYLSYMPHLMVVWNMRARNLGKEMVNVPAGPISCYKIQLETNEPFSRFAFGDKTFFWMQTAPPHQLVKSRFPAAGETSVLVDYRRN